MDTLNYRKLPIYAWVTDQVWRTLDQEFIDYYLSNRVEKSIPAYVIAPDTKQIRVYQSQDVRYLRKTLLEDAEGFMTSVEIDLYGDQSIGIMAFQEKIGLIIESRKLWVTLKSIFDRHWDALGGEKV